MTKAFLPQMKAKNHGHIVTIASALGLFSTACVEVRHLIINFFNYKLNTSYNSYLYSPMYFFLQDYCASKFAAVGFHESLTQELRAEDLDGMKSTLVCPYIVDTGMFAGCEIR